MCSMSGVYAQSSGTVVSSGSVVTQTIGIVPTWLDRLMRVFPRVGMDVKHDAMLLLEKMNLHQGSITNTKLNILYKFVTKYARKTLPHKECKVGTYTALGHDFYKQIGLVVPAYNKIAYYQLVYEDQTVSRIYAPGSGDVDRLHDNCNDEYATLDNKSAQCARRMRSYFGIQSYKILECKP
ncbi:MAG TPA: hypothetical protein PK048_03490 [Candidatus Absconditabacterales bacterium]|nr:hypothetical protein [Candidatus Absconditabacterales bacterium]